MLDRFFSKIKFDENTWCWNWTAGGNEEGYGKFKINRKKYMAHRVAFMLFKGIIHQGLVIDHLCRNHGCCNPDHMEAVTIQENILRGVGMGSINAKKTHCPKGHDYSIFVNGRYCKTCKNEYERKRMSDPLVRQRQNARNRAAYHRILPEQRWARDLLRAEGVMC